VPNNNNQFRPKSAAFQETNIRSDSKNHLRNSLLNKNFSKFEDRRLTHQNVLNDYVNRSVKIVKRNHGEGTENQLTREASNERNVRSMDSVDN